MKTVFTKLMMSSDESGETSMLELLKMKASVNRLFIYAVELTLLFLLVFATVSTFAQAPATATSDQGKLDLVKQTVVYNGGKVYLNWIAKTNSIDCIYVIERSTDGEEYEPVGLKEGIGSKVELLYSWVDTKPGTGGIHYRIKQINDQGNLVAQADPLEMNTPENPLFIDKGSRMVMVK